MVFLCTFANIQHNHILKCIDNYILVSFVRVSLIDDFHNDIIFVSFLLLTFRIVYDCHNFRKNVYIASIINLMYRTHLGYVRLRYNTLDTCTGHI